MPQCWGWAESNRHRIKGSQGLAAQAVVQLQQVGIHRPKSRESKPIVPHAASVARQVVERVEALDHLSLHDVMFHPGFLGGRTRKSDTDSNTSSGRLSAMASRICRPACGSTESAAKARSLASALGHWA